MIAILYLLITISVLYMFAYKSVKRPEIIIYGYLIFFILTTFEWINGSTISLNIFAMNVGLTDLFCTYLAFFWLIKYSNQNMKWVSRKNKKITFPKVISILLIVVFIVFTINLIRGVYYFGFTVGVLEDSRRLIEAWIIPLFSIVHLPISLSSIRTKKALNRFTDLVIAFCLFSWFLNLIGLPLMTSQSDAGSTMRVLRPEQTIVLAIIAFYYLDMDIHMNLRPKISLRSQLLFIIVILLQHRSVWASLAVGLLVFILMGLPNICKLRSKIRVNKNLLLQTTGLILLIPVTIVLIKNTQLYNYLLVGLDGFKGNEGSTLDYRNQIWVASLRGLTQFQWIFGKEFGSGYSLFLEGYSRSLTPHSAYIHSILRLGIVGLIAVVVQIISLVVYGIKRKRYWLVVSCFMTFTFWISYTYSIHNAFILALSIRTLLNEKRGVKNEVF